MALLLAVALVLSVLANALLFHKGRSFYLELSALRLDPYQVAAFPQRAPATSRPILVVYGDSRAAEWTLPSQRNDFTVVNRGIASQTTAQVLGRLREHALDLEPDIILLQVGINDLKTIPLFPEQMNSIIEVAFRNIEAIVSAALADGVCVILTTVFPVGTVPLYRHPFWSSNVEVARQTLNEKLQDLAGEGIVVLDFDDILQLAYNRPVPHAFRDMLHFNPAAYELFRPRIEGAAQQLVERHDCGL